MEDLSVDDFEQRCAEALAEAFTSPSPRMVRGRPTDELADPLPGDRINKTMSVMFTAGDGHPSFRMVTCAEAAAVCAAVRDPELEEYRRRFGPLSKETSGESS